MNTLRVSDSIRKIAIAGAGPAGTSLAIRLIRKGFDVTLVERERFPRHKLCGEFISPECIGYFRELGVAGKMLDAGGERIGRTIFYAQNGKSVEVPSDWFVKESPGALGLSRATMDFVLLSEAKSMGVRVLEEASVKEITLEKRLVKSITVKGKDIGSLEIDADIFVDATGRSRVVSKLAERALGIQKRVRNQKWVGLKAHFKNVEMDRGRCEIYFFRGGYGGLNHVEKNAVNHCFLIRADVVREFGGNSEAIFREVVLKNRRAAETLRNAARVNEWIAVSIDEFGQRESSPAENLFSVGDSAAFIDPFTGSGMLMALESSKVFVDSLEFSNGARGSLRDAYGVGYGKRFSKRLRVCKAMRKISFSPLFAGMAIRCLRTGGILRYGIARATRTAV